MYKMNLIALVLTAIALSACGKKEAEALVESVTVTPGQQGGGQQQQNPSAVKWSGNGKIAMTGSPEMACATVTAELFEDAQTFELRKFTYDCSGMTADMDTLRFELRGSELFLGTEKVGEKKDNVTAITMHDPSGAILGFRFETNGTALKLEHTMKANGFEQKLNANLQR